MKFINSNEFIKTLIKMIHLMIIVCACSNDNGIKRLCISNKLQYFKHISIKNDPLNDNGIKNLLKMIHLMIIV